MMALVNQSGTNNLSAGAQATFNQMAQELDAAEQMSRQMNITTEALRARILEGSRSFQIMARAKDQVIQTAPKTSLLLVGGFFTALILAAVLTALVRLLSHTRRPPPPTESVS